MADYTTSELLNEVAKLFRARIEAVRSGGTLNTREEYEQLKEVTSITFVMNPEAIFYLAFLASNRLAATVAREVAFIEDMLVSLDDLSQVATSTPDTTDINNANTALLALDAAVSVRNRPEVQRFSNLMDKVARSYKPNLTNRRKPGRVIQPREEAQAVIRADLAQLKVVHSRMLDALYALRDLLVVFDDLDIPSLVSTNVLRGVRQTLDELASSIDSDSASQTVARSRRGALTVLASKAAVNILSDFRDPGELKLRSPLNPIPPTLSHRGEMTGSGVAATVLSGAGPWKLPLVDPLELKIDGGALQQVPLADVVGVALNGESPEPFSIGAGTQDLNVTVDPAQYEGTIKSGTTLLSATEILLTEQVPLKFVHLGGLVSFPEANAEPPSEGGTGDPNNLYHRAIVEMPILQVFPTATYSSTTKLLTVTLPGTPVPGSLEDTEGFESGHEGMWVEDSAGARFEIVEVVTTTGSPPYLSCYLDDRGQTVNVTGAVTLRGQRVAAWNPAIGAGDRAPTRFTVGATLANVPTVGELVVIGPSVKNARLTATTAAGVVSEVNNLAGTAADAGHVGADLGLFAQASTVAGDPTRVALKPRTRVNPYLQIAPNFLKPLVNSGPGLMEIVAESAGNTLGFLVGASIEGTGFDTNDLMTPEEFAGLINDNITGATASAENSVVTAGGGMSTVVGQKKAVDSTADFVSQGVKAADVLQILTGPESGSYVVTNVAPTELTVDRLENFSSNTGGRSYQVLRLGVRITSNSDSDKSSIEVTGPAEFGFPSGIVRGTQTRFQAKNSTGDLLTFRGLVEANDTIRLIGVGTYTVVQAFARQLELTPGVPSGTKGVPFEVLSKSAEAYGVLNEKLTTFTTSGNLLKKNGYDESLDELDAALTSVLLQGQSFASARGRARQFLLDLLGILTESPNRQDEYSGRFRPASITLLEELRGYVVPSIRTVDSLITTFRDRKYERAADLLIRGKLRDFYSTDEETGSYGGAVVSSSRKAVKDLPVAPTSFGEVENNVNLATGFADVPDPEEDFDDYDESLEIDL